MEAYVMGFTAFDEIIIPTSARHNILFVIDEDCKFYLVRVNNQQEVMVDDDVCYGISDGGNSFIPNGNRQSTQGEDVGS
jgi:hypothetical protein